PTRKVATRDIGSHIFNILRGDTPETYTARVTFTKNLTIKTLISSYLSTMGSTTPKSEPLPYWQVNVPPAERETECPLFLQNLKAKDTVIISTPDSSYRTLTWAEVREIIANNALDVFQRIPSDLRRYFAYSYFLKQKYGSVMNFVVRERLGWREPIVAEGKPFQSEGDVKILWNDWPYGIDSKIVHLVVWTKFELEDNPMTDDLTDEARSELEEFVQKNFGDIVGRENASQVVIWFKNWRVLKSIHSVEHFHIMLYDPDPEFIKIITNGDTPLNQRLRKDWRHPQNANE
ncbi:hypothetical protein JHW43_004886, partial [Diplocarpon mali]